VGAIILPLGLNLLCRYPKKTSGDDIRLEARRFEKSCSCFSGIFRTADKFELRGVGEQWVFEFYGEVGKEEINLVLILMRDLRAIVNAIIIIYVA